LKTRPQDEIPPHCHPFRGLRSVIPDRRRSGAPAGGASGVVSGRDSMIARRRRRRSVAGF
jgi:hypothetical protein